MNSFSLILFLIIAYVSLGLKNVLKPSRMNKLYDLSTSLSFVVSSETSKKKKATSAMLSAFLLSSTLLPLAAPAHAIEQVSFESKQGHYSLNYPSDWTQNEATLSGERKLKVFQSPTDKTASVSVVYTPIPADFMRLSAFGDIQQYLIPKGDGIHTEVISESTKGETYTLEYTSEAPGIDPPQPMRHVITVFALRPQEAVIGLTAQASAGTFEASKETFTSIVKSLQTNL